jgi:hypothetical protein
MRAFLMAGIAATLVSLVSAAKLASAQQAPAPTPGAEESKQGRSAAVRSKRQACRQEGQGKGSRRPDLQDYVAICVAEAQVACLKQAVEQKVRGPARRDFIAKCLGGDR